MTDAEFKTLEVGDIVTHADGDGYLVVAKTGEGVVLNRTIVAHNPREWTRFKKRQTCLRDFASSREEGS